MRTERSASVLLSILLLTSLITPLLISITITSVGTVKAATDHVVISEVFYDESSTDTNEFVELYNPTSSSVDIGGWKLKFLNQTGTLYWTLTFGGGTTIAPLGYYLIGQKSPLDSADWGGSSITPDAILPGSLQNGPGDYVILEKGDETYVDGVRWGAKTSGSDIPDDPNYADISPSDSIERKSGPTHDETKGNGYDTDDASNDFRTRDIPEPQNSSSPSEPTLGVSVSVSPSENSGLPEATLTYTVVTKNNSEVVDNYILTVSDNENWGPTLDDNLFSNVGPGENGTTTLRVTIPVDAEDGDEDLITVTATSQENGSITDNDSSKAICYLVPLPQHYKEYPADDQAVMEGKGNLSENYKYTLPCGRYHLDSQPRERSFLKFDISSIPPGATIENAYLGVYHHFGVYTEGRWCWVEVWTVENDNWTENDIDWSNQPPKVENLYHEYIDYTSFSPNPWLGTIHGWPGVPVKSYIENEIADGAASFILYSPQEDLDPSENTDVDFTAKEDDNYPGQWPYLEIWYYENLPPVLFSVSISPGFQAGRPGENLEYTVTVKNRGTINDNYDLVVSDNAIPSWDPTLSYYLLNNVPPGENRTVTLSVTIPANAAISTRDNITVTATSQADNRLSDSASAEAIATGPGVWVVASYSPYIEGYGVGVTGAGENIYIANSLPEHFMCYNSVDDTWQNLSVPSGLLWKPGKPGSMIGAFKNGTCMAWDNGDYLYTLFGASYADGDDGYYRHYFYRYSISNDTWEQLENTLNTKGQGAGDAITWVPGSVLGTGNDWIYAIVGSASHGTSFWRYNISTDTWGSMSFNPGWTTTDDGCSLVWTGDNYLYALRGEWMESSPCYDFARYDLLNDNWEDMAPIPAYPWGGGAGGVGDGGSLLWIGGGYSDFIYALSGNQCIPEPIYDNRFYLYTISTNTWQRLADMPGGVGSQNGPRLGFASGSMGKIYCWRGCEGDPVLWAYLPTEVEPPSEVEVRLDPIDDSYVVEGDPTILNLGDNYNFYVGWEDNENFLVERAYLKFDLSGISEDSIIDNAVLYANTKYGASNGPPNYDPRTIVIDAENVSDDSWDENTLNWDNKPPMGPTVLDSETVDGTYEKWYSWDVTSYTQGEFAGDKTVSIGLISENENTDASVWFYSKDAFAGQPRPYLKVTYTSVKSYAVQVSIDPGYQSGLPGDTLNYTVTVANIGVENDNFDLEVSDNESWGLSLSDNSLEILAGENENVTLSVTIPGDAEYCTEDLITVTAISKTHNTVKDSASCIAHQDYFEKENMPDLGQHSENWSWVAAAANSIYWYSQHGYPELIDNIDDPTPYDNRYITDPLVPDPDNPACPGHYVLFEVIASHCNRGYSMPVSDNDYLLGLRSFIAAQGALLEVHEIIDPTWVPDDPDTLPLPLGESGVEWQTPTFEDYRKELLRCQDVILWLDFEYENIDHVVTGVAFYENQWILISDPWSTGAPDHNNDFENKQYDNCQIISEDPFRIFVPSWGQTALVPKMIYISPTAPWSGTAVISLLDLYTLNVEKILDLNLGSKLVVKFYTYTDAFENENVIDNFTTPPTWHVEENENARHPEGIGTKKARLDLTTDNTEDVISTIATFVATKDVLFARIRAIKGRWPYASPSEKDNLFAEIRGIKGQWPYAPT